MKFGLTQSEYSYILKTVVDPIEKFGGKVWCFGSRARGDHQKFSDLDLYVEIQDDLMSLIGDINEVLVESNFPYKVDIVMSEDFADAYRDSFEHDKQPFKA